MAGNYRIYYHHSRKEHSLNQWLDADNPKAKNEEVMRAVMEVVPVGVAPSILRVIELNEDGKPMLYDEFRIVDSKGQIYGLIFTKVGSEGWFYLSDYESYGSRPGKPITGNSFMIPGTAGYLFSNKEQFPALATLDWERLSVLCNGEEFYLEPWSPSPG
ncbi:hypothetical protein I6G46_04310 [Serratia plymuthica]|uniref:hypothetical protein n=1 Tax=Serratia plymuthica TaxID=82996 RepID=UPI0018D6E03B|nr:hypothetical protein [Serratia plymuthica]QPS88206.1 hypothetical protein I6G46_04310 [Serratia plymuthica]